MGEVKLSVYAVASPVISDASGDFRVLYSTRSGAALRITDDLWQKLTEGRFPSEEDGLALRDAQILVPRAADELAEVMADNDRAISQINNIYLAIQPTRFCQLACTYCGQSHNRTSMGDRQNELLLRWLDEQLRTEKFQRVDVSWFGGEPSLATSQIEELSEKVIALCKSGSIRYSAKMVTNGHSLTKRRYEKFLSLGINHFEVTLDGDLAWHDSRRPVRNGRPSFEVIFRNICEIVNSGTYVEGSIGLRCNVDLSNTNSIEPLLDRLSDAGLASRVSDIYFAPVHSWGNDAHEATGDMADFAAFELKWLLEAARRGFHVGLVPRRKPIVCMSVRPEALLVDASGELFNCSEVSYVPAYEVDGRNTWSIGSLEDGEAPGARNRLGRFNDKVASGALPCSTCEILPICGGSCPKMWDEGLIPCPPTKFNLSAKLAISYLLADGKLEGATVSHRGIHET